MSLKKKVKRKLRLAGKTIRFCVSCTSWGEYDIDDFEKDNVEGIRNPDVSHSYVCQAVHWFMLQGKSRLPFSAFEEALWNEDFAVDVPIKPDVSCPVLKVCLGFRDHELKSNKKLFYYSYTFKESDWDRSLLQSEFAVIASENYPDDPIIDGLPASMWLECVEPTLCIMLSLCRLKHRKSNITTPKKYPEYPDSAHSRHGDYEYGPVAIFAGPRRASIRVDFVLQHLQDDAAAIIEMSYHSERSRNRRRRIAERNRRQLLQRQVEAEVNKNQSANPSGCSECNNRPVRLKLRKSKHKKDIKKLANSHSQRSSQRINEHRKRRRKNYFQNIRRDQQLFNVPDNSINLLECNQSSCSIRNGYAEEYDGNQSSCSIRNVYADEYDGNTNQSAIRYPLDSYKLTPVLYIWNSESRTSDVETTPANRYDMMSSVHFSYKMFATALPNTEEHSVYGRNLCELASMDSVVRRYLLQCFNKPPEKDDTWFDRVYTEHYLRTEKDPEPAADVIENTPEVHEHQPLHRKMGRNIRSGFRRVSRWFSVRTFFFQREIMDEIRRRIRCQHHETHEHERVEEMWDEPIQPRREVLEPV